MIDGGFKQLKSVIMKTTVVLTIAAFFFCTIGGSKVNGQTVSNVGQANSRKATVEITIDGKPFKSGDILAVKPGQKLQIAAEIVGGRRDYCKFPDTDKDLSGIAEIYSRGENGITYQINSVKAEWKLINEAPQYASDKYLQIKPNPNKTTSEITISNDKFSQTFLRLTIKTKWQFTQNGKTTYEDNTAEETIYFKLSGESDVWFLTKNIQATGIKNDLVKEKLKDIQSAYDSIESNFYRLNFSALQQSNRNLQTVVSSLKSTIDDVKASNPSYQVKVVMIGLPSDSPYNDVSVFSVIESDWDSLAMMLTDQKQQLNKLPAQFTAEGTVALTKIITSYVNWQQKLNENTLKVLSRYIPNLNEEKVQIPVNIYSVSNGKMVINYTQALKDFSAFLDLRILQVQDEIQSINSTKARLQVVKLFDGMLRSYVSSIYWAEWKNTRETELLTLSQKDNL